LELSFALAFAVGFFSTIHCLGMCGGIMGALSLSLPKEVRDRPGSLLMYVLLYNLGRILIYILLGVVIGLTGQLLEWGAGGVVWRQIAGFLAAVTMILIGFYLTGWFPLLRNMDRLGGFVWKRLEPVGRRLLPIKTLPGALLAGLVWGWLPCGLVYYALFLALPLGDPWLGGVFMFIFGLGTLPAMVATGTFTGWLTRLGRKVLLRKAAGVVMILIGLLTLLFGTDLFLLSSKN
jgi:sulfite exporter TauE/SafE